jgi:molybdate transport system substrate-binding protein
MNRWSRVQAGALALALAASSCQAKKKVEPAELVVFAAASLRETLAELANLFEAKHPGIHIALNFAGTQQLRAQLEQGARADLFLSADERQMKALQDEHTVKSPELFVCNSLVVVVPANAPPEFQHFADLPRANRIVLAAPEVPVGEYSELVLEKAQASYGEVFTRDIRSHVVSRELDTRHVLSKVLLGEADAAIVYWTDAKIGDSQIRPIEIPEKLQVYAHYPGAVVRGSHEADLAEEFLKYLGGPEGARVFRSAGFIGCPDDKK